MSKVLLSLFMLTLWGQLLIEKLRKSLGLPFSIRLFFVFSAVVWILVAQCCKRQENFLFFSSLARVCFSVDYDHCTENCCRCANFFFRKEQLPFVAVALIAAETGWVVRRAGESLAASASKVAQATIIWAAAQLSSRCESSAKIFFVEQTAKLPSKRPRFKSRQKLFFKKKNLLKFKYWLFVLVLLGSLFSNQKIVSGTTLVLKELSPCYPYRVWNKF